MMVELLDRGILLEDVDVLLPWGASQEMLRKLGSPQTRDEKVRVSLYWNKHKILGDKNCQIEATFFAKDANLPGEPNGKEGFSLASLRFHDYSLLEPRMQHKMLKLRFTSMFGKPSFDRKSKKPFLNLPFTEWNLPNVLVVLMVFERFGEYCVGEIWHKPLPIWRKPS